jgi:hypothetical protein
MSHRQDGHKTVFSGASLRFMCRHYIVTEIAMAQHYAFCIAGGAGGVNDCGQRVGIGEFGPAIALEGLLVFFNEREVFDVNHQCEFFQTFFRYLRQQSFGYIEHLRFGMAKNIGNLVCRGVGQNGDGHAAECGSGEKGQGPIRHILRKNRYAVTRTDSEARKSLALKVAGIFERSIGIRLAAFYEFAEGPLPESLGAGFQEFSKRLGIVVAANKSDRVAADKNISYSVWMTFAHYSVQILMGYIIFGMFPF